MRNFLLIISTLFFSMSCSEKGLEKDVFLNKIEVKKWNQATLTFLKSNCSSELLKYYNGDSINKSFVVLKNGDTINSIDKHLNYYLKHRHNFLSDIQCNLKPFTKNIRSLVILENYAGLERLNISYTVFSENMNKALRVYYKGNNLEKKEKLDRGFKEYNLDSIKTSNPECNINYTPYLNIINFDTVINLDTEGNLVYEIKNSFLGNYILD